MCQACDRNLSAMDRAEFAHDAQGVAAIAARVFVDLPNNVHGALVGRAIGVALLALTEKVITDCPLETFTPTMREWADRIGAAGAKVLITAYERDGEPHVR